MKVKNVRPFTSPCLQLKEERIKTNEFLFILYVKIQPYSSVWWYWAQWKKNNTKYIKWMQISTRWRMLKDFSKERFSHKSTPVWTYILEKPPVLRQALGCQRFCDMVEGEQCSVLLQAILTLDWLQQNGNELRPLLWAIQAGHLRYQHCNLGCNLQQNRDRKRKMTTGKLLTESRWPCWKIYEFWKKQS